jgi:hypothetical protein
MARLFITPREIDFISDITKEIIKDVVGQRVFYYHVREDVSEVHDVYEEAVEKIFDNPVEIDARIEWQDPETSTTNFGVDQFRSATAYFQYSDLLDKEIELVSICLSFLAQEIIVQNLSSTVVNSNSPKTNSKYI